MNGLDPRALSEFWEILKELPKNITAISMTVHHIFRTHEVAHRIGIM